MGAGLDVVRQVDGGRHRLVHQHVLLQEVQVLLVQAARVVVTSAWTMLWKIPIVKW